MWLEPPDRIRTEEDLGDGARHVSVKSGARWWTWSPEGGGETNEGADEHISMSVGGEWLPMLDPAPLIGLLDWRPLGGGRLRRAVDTARRS